MSTSAFSSYAADYDKHFTNSAIGILQRKRVFKFLAPLLNKNTDVLEINCGTGEDALAIAPLVKSILATDISGQMIKEAIRKKEKTSAKNIRFEIADLKELHQNLSSPFTLLFSDFGGLNCLSPLELKKFSKNIAPYISDKGKLVLVIMGKKCLWENFLFLKQKDKRFKRRNTDQGIKTQINETYFHTYYYSPSDIAEIFSTAFTKKLVRPIGLFVPPSYFNPYFKNKRWLLNILNFLEKITGSLPFTSNYADHYLVILEKNQSIIN